MTDSQHEPARHVFDYSEPAEIYVGRGAPRRHGLRFKQFNTAAEAIRYTMEHPCSADEVAVMECGEKRYSGSEMAELYYSEDFPLQRPVLPAGAIRPAISVPVSQTKREPAYRQPPALLSRAAVLDAPVVQSHHRYKVGARLKMQDGGNNFSRQGSTCRVTFILPFEGTQLLYRVKSELEAFERVVTEADLAPMPNA
jgi:hypothetical protein